MNTVESTIPYIILLNYLYYPEEGLFDRPKYWLSLFISLYIFGFLFVVWRRFFFTSLLSTSTPVSTLRFIDLDPAAVLVPVAFFFYILYPICHLAQQCISIGLRCWLVQARSHFQHSPHAFLISKNPPCLGSIVT